MNSERIKEIQRTTAYPYSVSVQQALLQVWNECEQEKAVKNNAVLPHVINSATAQMIHYDLAIKVNELMKQHDTMKVEDFRELPEVKRLWNAMDVIKEHYL